MDVEIKKNKSNIQETKNWDGITIFLITLSGVFLIFSFFAPIIFTKKEIFKDWNFSNTGQIGDTFGGIVNPFIALVGVLLTFLAFYMQIKANKIQRELFYKGIEENKKQFEQELASNREQLNSQIEIQTRQFLKSEFESQFYEMLKLHKENVNEVIISRKIRLKNGFRNIQHQYIEIKGRKAFEEILIELENCYDAAKKAFPNNDKNYCLNRAYSVFFFGINSDENGIKRNFYDEKKEVHKIYVNDTNFMNEIKEKFDSFYGYLDGYATFLAHFYRHLFQIVKFIAVQNEELISYEEKRKYIRILRAQLSNPEQALLFYNWKSGFGSQWENNSNKFFTDYRMIHNIYDSLMIEDFNPVVEFESQIRNKTYRKENGRNWDPLFEFEDWK